MELKNKKFVFLGDSITEGVNTIPFHQQLKEMTGLRETINCGIGGTRIARQIEMNDTPYDNDFNLRVDALDSEADGIVVMGGTNDYGHGQAPLGKIEDRDVQRLLREVDTKDLAMSLKGSKEEVRDKILRNMSERAQAMLREDM